MCCKFRFYNLVTNQLQILFIHLVCLSYFDLDLFFKCSCKLFFTKLFFLYCQQMKTPYHHHKKVRPPCSVFMMWSDSFLYILWNFPKTHKRLNSSHSSCQGKCMTSLLVSWEGETRSLVSVAILKSQISTIADFCGNSDSNWRLKIFSGFNNKDNIAWWNHLVMSALTDNGPWRREYPERRGIFLNKCRLRWVPLLFHSVDGTSNNLHLEHKHLLIKGEISFKGCWLKDDDFCCSRF